MAKLKANSFAQVLNFVEDFVENASEVVPLIQHDVYLDAKKVERGIKSNHPWDDITGRLTKSHRVEKRGKLEVAILATAPYAKYLYYGTKKHKAWNGVLVSGVWGGQKRLGRSSGAIDTPENAPEKGWIHKGWDKQAPKTVKRILKTVNKHMKL